VLFGRPEMLIEGLFDEPLWGNHSPLVMRWHDDQLKPLVDRFSPLMPDSLRTRPFMFALTTSAAKERAQLTTDHVPLEEKE
jgi:hypothetical protein